MIQRKLLFLKKKKKALWTWKNPLNAKNSQPSSFTAHLKTSTERQVSAVAPGTSFSLPQSIIITGTTFYSWVYSNCPRGPSLPPQSPHLISAKRVSRGATDSQLLTLRRPQELHPWRGIHNDTWEGESHGNNWGALFNSYITLYMYIKRIH